MKTIKTLLFAAVIAIVLSSCGKSIEKVTKNVKSSMEEEFQGKGITIKRLDLVKKLKMNTLEYWKQLNLMEISNILLKWLMTVNNSYGKLLHIVLINRGNTLIF